MSRTLPPPRFDDPAVFGRVAVLMGGTTSEREVSLDSGRNVLEALRARGIDANGVDGIPNLVRELQDRHFDRVFNILHGGDGESGVLQGLLESLRVPYTGSGVLGILATLAQQDVKRILAYSSVENIGIIALALGLGLVGLQAGATGIAVLCLAAALFHVSGLHSSRRHCAAVGAVGGGGVAFARRTGRTTRVARPAQGAGLRSTNQRALAEPRRTRRGAARNRRPHESACARGGAHCACLGAARSGAEA